MPLAIRRLGDPILRRKADPVPRINAKLRALAKEMEEAMDAANGIGLAAPQVGASIRLIVLEVPRGELPPFRATLANPKILSRVRSEEIAEEGCLSIPGVVGDVSRSEGIRVEGVAMNGRKVAFEETGLIARAFQHEIDHLDGVLFIDRIGCSEATAKRAMEEYLDEVRRVRAEGGSAKKRPVVR